MPLPRRFETYKGFTINPQSIQIGDPNGRHARWSIGGTICRENDSTASEEDFHEKGQFAASHEEALDRAISFAKQLIDARESA